MCPPGSSSVRGPVVVVWKPTSIASRWVRGEARVGAERNVLVPVRFEGVQSAQGHCRSPAGTKGRGQHHGV